VVKANRNGDGVTVRRGYLAGTPCTPFFNKLSNPADAGDVGCDPDDGDNKLVNDFLGEAILLNFLDSGT